MLGSDKQPQSSKNPAFNKSIKPFYPLQNIKISGSNNDLQSSKNPTYNPSHNFAVRKWNLPAKHSSDYLQTQPASPPETATAVTWLRWVSMPHVFPVWRIQITSVKQHKSALTQAQLQIWTVPQTCQMVNKKHGQQLQQTKTLQHS